MVASAVQNGPPPASSLLLLLIPGCSAQGNTYPENGTVVGNGTKQAKGLSRRVAEICAAATLLAAVVRPVYCRQPGLGAVFASNFLPSLSGTGFTLAQACFGATAR